MAYLGNAPARSFISFEKQVFTIVNSQTAYTLSNSVTNENDIRLVINNVVQEPGAGKAYTASGTTLTLSAALTNGTDEMYCVFLGKAVGTVNAPAGSVAASQLAADSVTAAKLNDDIISGQTELATAPASTDELLISDAGTLKRIDASLVGGDNTPAFYGELASVVTLSRAVTTAITGFTQDEIDTDSAFDGTTFTVPSGEGGKYALTVTMTIDFGDVGADGETFTISLLNNGSTVKQARTSTNASNFRNINIETCTIETIQTLAEGDAITFKAYGVDADGGGGGKVQANKSSVQGYKLIGV